MNEINSVSLSRECGKFMAKISIESIKPNGTHCYLVDDINWDNDKKSSYINDFSISTS